MPELPEVETVKNTLEPLLLGQTIMKVDVYYDKIIRGIKTEQFSKQLVSQKFNCLKRIGKYIIFELDNNALISHLRMEGKFFYTDKLNISKHDHIVFSLSNGHYLIYNDTRRFGTMNLEQLATYQDVRYLKKLGYEPLDSNLSSNYLYDKLHNRNIAIKTALLDQTIISGLGNIYVDEVLFLAKLLPTTKCSELLINDFDNIVNSSRIVINKAIALGGTTIKSFTSSEGVHGRFQNHLNVHTMKHCSVCNSAVTKIKVNGRGTYYCSNCQR